MTDEMTSLRGLLEQSADADVPASMTFPAAHRTKRHSTDRLECVNGEIKRRTDVVGIFPDGASIKRLVGAVLLEQDDESGRPAIPLHDTGKHRPRSATVTPSACRPW